MFARLRLFTGLRDLNRNLKVMYVSFFLWTFGLGLYNYVWSLFIRGLGADSGDIGLAYAVGYVAFAATMIPGGILSNKYDLKKVLLWSWGLSIPVPIINILARSWQVATIGLVVLQLTSFGLPAYNAFIVANANPASASSAFGSSYSAAPLGLMLSPILGSLIVQWTGGLTTVFALSFVLFTVSTLVLLRLESHPPKPEDRNLRLELPRSRRDVTILAFLASSAFAFSLAYPFLPI